MSPYLLEVDKTMSKICFKLNPAGVEGRRGPRMKQDGHAVTITETVIERCMGSSRTVGSTWGCVVFF